MLDSKGFLEFTVPEIQKKRRVQTIFRALIVWWTQENTRFLEFARIHRPTKKSMKHQKNTGCWLHFELRYIMYAPTIITCFMWSDVVVELGLSSMELDSRLVEICGDSFVL